MAVRVARMWPKKITHGQATLLTPPPPSPRLLQLNLCKAAQIVKFAGFSAGTNTITQLAPLLRQLPAVLAMSAEEACSMDVAKPIA